MCRPSKQDTQLPAPSLPLLSPLRPILPPSAPAVCRLTTGLSRASPRPSHNSNDNSKLPTPMSVPASPLSPRQRPRAHALPFPLVPQRPAKRAYPQRLQLLSPPPPLPLLPQKQRPSLLHEVRRPRRRHIPPKPTPQLPCRHRRRLPAHCPLRLRLR